MNLPLVKKSRPLPELMHLRFKKTFLRRAPLLGHTMWRSEKSSKIILIIADDRKSGLVCVEYKGKTYWAILFPVENADMGGGSPILKGQLDCELIVSVWWGKRGETTYETPEVGLATGKIQFVV